MTPTELKQLRLKHDKVWRRGNKLYEEICICVEEVNAIRKRLEVEDPDYDPVQLLFKGTIT